MALYLVDSSIFIFRAWFAQKLTHVNQAGEPNQAFIGFSDFVYQLLTDVAPSKMVFAFDESLKQSQRKSIYPEYKANRSPAPEELKRQFAWCQQWVSHLGFSIATSSHWEADDLIGTLAELHRSDTTPVVLLTADKDLAQLVREGDIWWPFFNAKKMDYRSIKKKFGVNPEQIADQLALTGDKVDNIPGIPFIGQKTAAGLLRKYGDLKTLRDNLTEVAKMKFRYASRVQDSLIANESVLDISSRLTEINCAVQGLDDLPVHRSEMDTTSLRKMMEAQAMDSIRQQKWDEYLSCG